MQVSLYDLDTSVFRHLNKNIDNLKDWKGAASGIADYVTSWGVMRFWAMSRSSKLLGGNIADEEKENEKRYYAWSVARKVLCEIVGQDLEIHEELTTNEFSDKFNELNCNQQFLLTDLLLEISEAIQFWTMRLDDADNRKSLV